MPGLPACPIHASAAAARALLLVVIGTRRGWYRRRRGTRADGMTAVATRMKWSAPAAAGSAAPGRALLTIYAVHAVDQEAGPTPRMAIADRSTRAGWTASHARVKSVIGTVAYRNTRDISFAEMTMTV